jgi:hypothetical protein
MIYITHMGLLWVWLVIFSFKLYWALLLLFIKEINIIQWKGLSSTTHLYKATEHTCTLRRAMKLIIPKITKARYHNMINAYKINKQQMGLHFLTHGLWSRTNLGMQQLHLELL